MRTTTTTARKSARRGWFNIMRMFCFVVVFLSFLVLADGFCYSSSIIQQQQQQQQRIPRKSYPQVKHRDLSLNHRPSTSSALFLTTRTSDSDEQQQQQQQHTDTTTTTTVDELPCYWKPKGDKSRWEQRLNIKDLKIGQKLSGHVVGELLEGTNTGPKLFFECGVGRTNKRRGKWNMVNAMMRLGRRGSKLSVAKKRSARYKKKDSVDLFVSRIQLECGRFEVCPTLEEVEIMQQQQQNSKTNNKMIPVMSLKQNQEVQGTIVNLLPYGAMVDVGANRLGLLHINKIADLYGHYIDKEKGMIKAGIERKAKVRLCVESIEKRRLALDFTPDVKKDAKEELERKAEAKKKKKKEAASKNNTSTTTASSSSSDGKQEEAAAVATASSSSSSSGGGDGGGGSAPQMSEAEMAQWAEYASQGDDVDDEDDNNTDRYDEERDIEDALGLGYY